MLCFERVVEQFFFFPMSWHRIDTLKQLGAKNVDSLCVVCGCLWSSDTSHNIKDEHKHKHSLAPDEICNSLKAHLRLSFPYMRRLLICKEMNFLRDECPRFFGSRFGMPLCCSDSVGLQFQFGTADAIQNNGVISTCIV